MTKSDVWFGHAMGNLDFNASLRRIKEEEKGNTHSATCLCADCSLYWDVRCLPVNVIYSLELPQQAESKRRG